MVEEEVDEEMEEDEEEVENVKRKNGEKKNRENVR